MNRRRYTSGIGLRPWLCCAALLAFASIAAGVPSPPEHAIAPAGPVAAKSKAPECIRGVYLNSASFYERKITETLHYAKEAGLNAVVMHVKDPYGHIYWDAENALAREMKASKGDKQLRAAIERFNNAGLWTIAKLDLFQDTLLAEHCPDWAVQDTVTGKPWYNKQDLAWGNPHDERVWDYNIALAKELIALGFDEIQFDYVRFPSDGKLSRVKYPKVLENKDRLQVIGAFLEKANTELKPLGAAISVDLFGFVAWMTYDFGVGQRIEEIAPHVDAICPMLYPSHFPKQFMGKDDPAKYPHEIMEESMKRLKKRTNVDIRAWVQGFWYQPAEIINEIKGIEAAGYKSFLIWSPSSQYEVTYAALAAYQSKTFADPKYYPTLADLAEKGTSELQGVTNLVNATDYVKGSTVLSLDQSSSEQKSSYTTPRQLVDTFDEAILDTILQTRGIESSWKVPRSTKLDKVLALLFDDLGISARTMRIEPIRVTWKGDCRSTEARGLPWLPPRMTPLRQRPNPRPLLFSPGADEAESPAAEGGATPTS